MLLWIPWLVDTGSVVIGAMPRARCSVVTGPQITARIETEQVSCFVVTGPQIKVTVSGESETL